jgi:hypothetical protein
LSPRAAHRGPLARSSCRLLDQGRFALTLIELLAALVLTSLLMTALLGTLRLVQQHATAVDGTVSSPSWTQILAARVRHDVLNSRLIHIRAHEFRLRGYAGDGGGGAWQPSDVVYRIEHQGGRTWLVRLERALAARSNQPVRRELMLRGCASFRVSRFDEGSEEPLLPPLAGLPPDVSIPHHLRVRFLDADGNSLCTSSIIQPRH